MGTLIGMARELLERNGILHVQGRAVPWVLWLPDGEPAQNLVLIGHGASGDKRESYVVALARMLAARGVASLAIDGPVHGERRAPATTSLPFFDFAAAWSSNDQLTDEMIVDWRAALDMVLESSYVEPEAAVGYWGLSMGTILGLPFVVSEPRIKACVLGLMGSTGPTKDRIVHDAQGVTIPTLFLVQWDDQLFHRRDTLDLFGQLAPTDKTLIATPGNHGDVTAESFQRSAEFLINRLGVSK